MAILMTSFQCHTAFSISINIFISVNNNAERNLTRHKNNPHVSKAIIDMLRVISNFSLTQLIPEVILSPRYCHPNKASAGQLLPTGSWGTALV